MKATRTGRDSTHRRQRWLIAALLVVTAFIAAPSFASADTGTGAPSVWTDQPSYAPGDVVGLSGAGFAPGDTVSVSLADSLSGWTSQPVDETVATDGSFTGAPITLPSTFSSSITATATDTATGDTASADVMETMPAPGFTPTISTDQQDYAPGSVVTITGSGWPAGDSLSVFTNDSSGNTWSQTDQATTDSSGDFTDKVTLPLMYVSNYSVTASDANGLTATTSFTDAVSSTTVVTSNNNPSSAGQAVTFTATVSCGSACTFTSGTVDFRYGANSNCNSGGTDLTPTPVAVTVTGSTTADATFTTSSLAAGSYSICARYTGTTSGSNAGNSASSVLTQTVNADTTPPTVNASLHNTLPASGWFTTSPQQVDVSAYDPSGVTNIQCKVDTGAYTDASSQSGTGTSSGSPRTGTFSVSGDGSHSVMCQATDGVGNTGAASGSSNTVTVPIDTTPPTGGAISVTPGYNTTGTVAVSVTNSADATSGIRSNQVQRAEVTLSGGSCGSFASPTWTNITLSSGHDTVASGNCVEYQLVATDNAGNQAIFGPSGVVMVDTAAPTSTFSFPASGTYYSASGWNGGCTSAGFCGSASDTGGSGVTGVKISLEDVATGMWWGGSSFNQSSETFFATSYASGSWSYGFAASKFPTDGQYTVHVEATDNAGNTETAHGFSFYIDTTPPTGGSVTYADGYNTTGTVPVSYTPATDSGSGIASNVLQSEYGTLSGGSCDFSGGSWAPVTLVSGNDSVPSGMCAKYRLDSFDNVGNEAIFDSTNVVKVDKTPPSLSLGLTANDGYDYVNGSTVYYNPSGSNTGSFTVAATTSDAESGIDHVAFPNIFSGSDGGSNSTGPSPYDWTYNWSAGATASGTQTVTSYNGALLSTDKTFTLTPDTTPPTGGSVTYADGYNTTGTVPVSYTPATDSGSGIASNVLQSEYGTLSGGSCDFSGGSWAPVTLVSGNDSVPSGMCAKYRLDSFDSVGNEAIFDSTNVVKVDKTPPSLSLGLTANDGYDYVNGSTVYYNPSGSNTGSFTVAATTSDAESGIDHVAFPNIFSGSDGGSNSTGPSPYDWTYNWSAGATASGTQTVTSYNGALLSTDKTFTLTPDTTPPTGGSVTYADGYNTTGTVPVSYTPATDSGSGIASNVLQSEYGTLSGGSCDFSGGSWAPVTLVSGNDSVPSGMCAKYRLDSFDNVGNEAIFDSTNVVKVDKTPPSLSLGLTANDGYDYVNGSTVYYNPSGSNTGSFTVAATTSDAESGIDHVAFPNIFSGSDGGSNSTGPSPYDWTYNWSAGATASGTQTVTSYNGALLSTDKTFTLTPDTTPPTGGSVTYADGYNTTGTVPVSYTPATDSGSGIASNVLQSEYGTLSGGSCDFSGGSWAPVTLVSGNDSVPSGMCAKYRLDSFDSVGNEAIFDSTNVVKVDKTPPSLSLGLTANDGYDYVNGSTVYYNPSGSNTGSFTVAATTSDAESGIDHVAFPNIFSGSDGGSNSTGPSPYDWTYNWSAGATASGTQTVTSYNGALLSTDKTFTLTPDTTPPTGGSVTYADGYNTTGTVPVSYTPATDSGSGIASNVLQSEYGTLSGGSCDFSGGSWAPVTLVSGNDSVPSGMCAKYRLDSFDNVGNEAIFDSTNVVKVDKTPPTGGAISVTAGYNTTGTVPVSVTNASDPESGMASNQVQRAEVTLSGGSCGSFASPTWTNITLSSGNDTVASGNCAEYRLVSTDNAHLSTTYGPTGVVKVDTTPPSAPVLTLNALDGFDYVSGSTVYYNPNPGNSGSFTVGATTADAQSGIDHVAFPTVFGSDGSSDSTSPYGTTYNWTDTATASGSKTVTSYDGAGLTASTDFTVTPDTTPPTGGSVTYANGYNTTGTVPVSVTNATDSGSGIASNQVQRKLATLSGGSCGTFAATWSNVTLSSGNDTVASGNCVEYQLKATDNVSNVAYFTSANVVKVDTNPPTSAITFPTAAGSPYSVSAYNSGCSTPTTGDICGTAADTGGSGLANVKLTIKRSDGEYWNGSTWVIGSTWVTTTWLTGANTASGTWSYGFTTSGGYSYTITSEATDNAGNVETSPTSVAFSVQAATTLLYTGDEALIAPTTGTLSATESSAVSTCTGLPISYSFDNAPGTGGTSYGPSTSPISFNASIEGVDTVTATVAATATCAGSTDYATMTIGSAGSKATGGGFLAGNGLPAGVGRLNFGFVVDLVPKTTNQYKGQFVLVNPELWRFKGNFGQASGGTYAQVTGPPPSGSGPVRARSTTGTEPCGWLRTTEAM